MIFGILNPIYAKYSKYWRIFEIKKMPVSGFTGKYLIQIAQGKASSFYFVRNEQNEMCLTVRLAFQSLCTTVLAMTSAGALRLIRQDTKRGAFVGSWR